MLLSEILSNIDILSASIPDVDIVEIVLDSRKVIEGALFVAMKGYTADGHDFIEEAVQNGAAAVVCEHMPEGVDIPHVLVEDSNKAMPFIASAFFGYPSRDMKVIGVTGTNGKTTVTYLIREILMRAGVKVGLVGTIQNMAGDEIIETERTTPDAFTLQRIFARMRDAGCKMVVMEVSSHALAQNRVDAVAFELGVFTNLTQDHLDYHRTMDAYFEAKARLFERSRASVINFDEACAGELIKRSRGAVLTYSAEKNEADLVAKDIKLLQNGVEFVLVSVGEIHRVSLPIPGMFSVYNALAAISACRALGMGLEEIVRPLEQCPGVRGRAEIVPIPKDFTVLIDYAHTPDGLENIIKTAKGYAQGRVITLFGCGGDRDKSKRPLMGNIASKYSDMTIITSDNPRTEDPSEIIKDIVRGLQENSNCVIIVNRREAIRYALEYAEKDDILILAGKGHETYQEISHAKVPFDEREIVNDFFEK